MEKLGIIAGNGKLPFIAAQSAHEKGHTVCVCAISGETDSSIQSVADEVQWVKLGELKKLVSFFKEHSVSEVCFEGKITKTSIFFGNVKPDLDMVVLFSTLKEKRDDTILGALCDYLTQKGLHVLDSTHFLEKCFPGKGVLTKKKLSKAQDADAHFGWTLAKESARLDIGQSVVVKDKTILAVEAIEGTDEAIIRGSLLGNKNVVVVKVAKPNQDMRFDVPTIGPTTLTTMIEHGARALIFEAGKTIFVDQEHVIRMANKENIVIAGF